ncbi:MAG TPA: hypothetical protein VGM98_24810 [Schlesneria sp.]|jgi:hypothetical protein
MTVRISRNLAAAFAVCGLMAGCGAAKTTVPISGVVKLDTKPLEKGLIEFLPIAPTPGAMGGSSIENGAYSIPADHGLQIGGKYTVRITATRKTGQQAANIMGSAGGVMDLFEQFLPEEYNTQSKLEAAITDASKRKFDFDLVSEAKPPTP